MFRILACCRAEAAGAVRSTCSAPRAYGRTWAPERQPHGLTRKQSCILHWKRHIRHRTKNTRIHNTRIRHGFMMGSTSKSRRSKVSENYIKLGRLHNHSIVSGVFIPIQNPNFNPPTRAAKGRTRRRAASSTSRPFRPCLSASAQRACGGGTEMCFFRFGISERDPQLWAQDSDAACGGVRKASALTPYPPMAGGGDAAWNARAAGERHRHEDGERDTDTRTAGCTPWSSCLRWPYR